MTNTSAGYLEASVAGNLPFKKLRAVRQPFISGLLRALLARHFELLEGPFSRDLRCRSAGISARRWAELFDSIDARPVPAYVGFA